MKPNQAKRRARKHQYKEQAARRKAEAGKQQPLQLELPVSMSEQETAVQDAGQTAERQPKGFQVASNKQKRKQAGKPKTKPKEEPRKLAAKPKETQPSFKPAPAKPAKSPVWRLYLALLITGLLTVWFSQDSINAYWQQTYHRASPLERLNDYAWWQAGSRWQQASLRRHDAALGWLEEHNENWRQQHTAPNRPAAVLSPAGRPEDAAQSAGPPAAASAPNDSGNDAAAIAQARSDRVLLSAGDKVFFAGDSMMEGVAPHVQRWLSSQYGIDSLNLSRQSTGLSYPSFFDWPATIEKTLREDQKIRLLVVFLGPNDPWDFPNPQPGTRGYLKFQSPEWEQVYRQRIERIVTAAQAANVRLIWLGVPPMKNRRLHAQMRYLDDLFASELAGKSIWLPTNQLMGDEDGQFRDSITVNGQAVRLRSKDGIHFTIKGQQFLADQIASRIDYRPASSAAPEVPAAASDTMAARGQ